jgi:hypothetical protein
MSVIGNFMGKIFSFIKEWGLPALAVASLICFIYISLTTKTKPPEHLKEFKDGIQNHLVWSIKGECFFVRPDTDVTVYLIRVNDCDKK